MPAVMDRRWLLGALTAVCLVWLWYSPLSPRVPEPPPFKEGVTPFCPLPPRVEPGEPPLQTDVPEGLVGFPLEPAFLHPLAGFSVEARVLSRENYVWGLESELAPTDLLLGWGRMAEDAFVSQFSFSQARRYGSYEWRGSPPLPPDEIIRSVSNMHIIPHDANVARELRRVKKGERVRIDGWLVLATNLDGFRWHSSLSREDTGNGACEIVYACAITRH